MMYGYGYGYWGMIIGTLITLIVLGGLVWLIVWAVRRTSSSSNNAFQSGGRPPEKFSTSVSREAKSPVSSTSR